MDKIIELRNIKTKVECVNWQQAIKEAGNLLVKSGYIKEGYVEEIIKTVETLGPYFVIIPHIALAHARPSDLVLRNGLSIITLKDPVEFGKKENDPVKIVIAFCAKSGEEHLDTLRKLALIFEEPEVIDEIVRADKPKTIYKILNR
ncbi:PTS system IIA component, L-Asc family [Anaerobranca californiensis DSM 14826]|uniref:Ascorbate-specific PTS system EIIA component n=1 Tax=Anaerobranca californiensis DSM 14826 TaxID=1120989 RepID=A0A1M6R9W8_9FIRM|nr:PTS sugar transporter subunit IIA [Anaerobranca californiensis]SHK29273.1 PTS system IIA component, L-Asc family [Anaerobranca californiensis DSM 14826]